MQYNGLGSKQTALTPPHTQHDYFHGSRAVSHGYSNGAPPRTSMSDIRRPNWRSVSVSQPASQHVAYLDAEDHSNTATPPSFYRNDVVARHLLVETALLDSQSFELLPIEEVDALKKEKAQLDSRIDASRRKLALESKVRDAAQSLHRLYSTKDRPATPQSPKKQRRSILGDRSKIATGNNAIGGKSPTLNQAGSELDASTKKIDELVQILSGLENRRQYVESRLLRHTAAVLQVAHGDDAAASKSVDGYDHDDQDGAFANGGLDSGYEDVLFAQAQIDSRKVQRNASSPTGTPALPEVQNEKFGDMQNRLEFLNRQMRGLIAQAKSGNLQPFDTPMDELHLPSTKENAMTRLETQLEQVEKSFRTLEQQRTESEAENEHALVAARHDQQVIEDRLEGVNNQVFSLMSSLRGPEESFELVEPPSISGDGALEQVGYLEETVQQLLEDSSRRGQDTRSLKDAQHSAAGHAAIASQYETVLHGLWDILSSARQEDDDDAAQEPFSIQAFRTRVQHMFDRSGHLDAQADILRRQIAQQRELNGKSDTEKDQQLAEHQSARATLEEELLKAHARHAAAETETGDARAELANVMYELDSFKRVAAGHLEQKQQLVTQLDEHKKQTHDLEATIADLHTQKLEHQDDVRLASAEAQGKQEEVSQALASAKAAKETAESRLREKEGEMEQLESEVVRLTTELTVKKAELDGAFGSRAERAKDVAMNPEIQAQLSRLEELTLLNTGMTAELAQLRQENELLAEKQAKAEERSEAFEQELVALAVRKESVVYEDTRMRNLEKELAEMANEYQELTRESVEVEKEREQLETLVDGLRERCDTLESQLSDEKVKWLGMKSPTTSSSGEVAREMTSTMVLRNEFKKMMRETRAEGLKLIRAEQEERRKLEAVVRSLRRESTKPDQPLRERFPSVYMAGKK